METNYPDYDDYWTGVTSNPNKIGIEIPHRIVSQSNHLNFNLIVHEDHLCYFKLNYKSIKRNQFNNQSYGYKIYYF